MVHRNAPLTPTGRERLARCVVADEWPLRAAAERFHVSVRTAARWSQRYRDSGGAGMVDRSSRPRHSPARTARHTEERVVRMRREHKIGPLRLASRCGLAPSTAHRVLVRHGMPPLAACDRASGEPVRRYERDRPGELVHSDVKKLGRIPDGGGHRVHGRAAAHANKARTPGGGYLYLHTALDIGRRFTRAWRPQTNGKVERFHRTLLNEWAYQQPYSSETARQNAFSDWLEWYNYHRPHTGIGGKPPATRVPNLPEQHS